MNSIDNLIWNPIKNKSSYMHAVWSTVRRNLTNKHLKALDSLIQHLLSNLNETSFYILTNEHLYPEFNEQGKKKRASTITEKHILDLIDRIFAKEENKGAYKDIITVLGLVIDKGNIDEIWALPAVPIPITVKREKNPFKFQRFHALKPGRIWAETVIKSIQLNLPLSDNAKVGRILTCAISRGGLLDKNSVEALLKQLNTPLLLANDISSIDLSIRWNGRENQEYRRWFPDALSEMLILRNDITIPENTTSTAWYYIRAFFKESKTEAESKAPKSLTKLIDAIALGIELKLPMFIAEYATRKNISHSLKRSAWLRLQGTENLLEDEQPQLDITQNCNEESFEDFGLMDWDKEIRSALRKVTLRDAQDALKDIKPKEGSLPLATYMLGWVRHLVAHGSKFSNRLSISTIRTYFSRASSRIYGAVGDQDVLTFNIEAFEEAYIQILEDEDKSRRNIARALREFHHYLALTYQVPELDNSILGLNNTLSHVDANIISIEEYEKTLQLLDASDLELIHPDLPKIAKLMTIIAFRCGLRRSEVLKLRLMDIQGQALTEALVRPHAARRLKSPSSKRRALLYAYLDDYEMGLFLDWVKNRTLQQERRKYSPFLFSIPNRRFVFVPEELIFPAIHQALRLATGDETVRFHSLRHSCASWNILRLMCADHGVPEKFFAHQEKTLGWLGESKAFKNTVCQHDHPTRKHLYASTAQLGHASSAMTLEHYIHWCDIMLHHALNKHLQPIDKQLWIRASGMSQASTYRLLNKDGELGLLNKARKQHAHKIALLNKKKGSALSADKKENINTAYPFILRAWKLLYSHSHDNIPLSDLAERHAFTIIEAEQLVKHASIVSMMRHSGRHSSFKHRFMVSDKTGERLLCPRRPTTNLGMILAEDFAERLLHLQQKHYDHYDFLISTYIENAKASSNEMVFKTPKLAKLFLESMSLLNIPNEQLTINWLHGSAIGKSDTDRKQYWANNLALSESSEFESKEISTTRPLGENGWVSIRIHDYLIDKGSLAQSTEAFRFVFIMCAILYRANKPLTNEGQGTSNDVN